VCVDEYPGFQEVTPQTSGQYRRNSEQCDHGQADPCHPRVAPVWRETDEEEYDGAFCKPYAQQVENIAGVFALSRQVLVFSRPMGQKKLCLGTHFLEGDKTTYRDIPYRPAKPLVDLSEDQAGLYNEEYLVTFSEMQPKKMGMGRRPTVAAAEATSSREPTSRWNWRRT